MAALLPKFIVVHIRVEDGDVYEYANAADGQVLGAVIGRTTAIGVDNESVQRRTYVDAEYAIRAMKQHCKLLVGREDVDFEQREGQPQIVLPRGPQIRLPRQ